MSQNLLQLQNAAKSFGARQLFSGATFAVNEGEHIGVIGPNGAGKTTLFKILAREIELDHGEVVTSRMLSMGYLKQHDEWNEGETVEEFLSHCERTDLWEMKKWGRGLGLSELQFASRIQSLSGGYRMRVKLLRLLGDKPNLMMLDEPTNYLDLETLLVLEEFLQNYDGAFLLISHDREFLKRTTDHILEIENGDFTKYAGHIDDYFEQKALLRSQLEKQASSEAARRKEVLDFAARFGAKATKARQVQSRLKLLEKRPTIEVKSLPVAAKVRIPPPEHTGKITLEVEDADFGYSADAPILARVHLRVEKGDRLAIVGYNGAGKSTLLKSLAKELAPLYGEVEWGYQVRSGYYAQHVSERLLPEDSVLESLTKAAKPTTRSQEILDLAGSLLFSGDQVRKKTKVLSGGEKARVALGQILLKQAPLLILDEPTNHLDFYTVEALTQALETYEGTVLFVSHDRGFVQRVATKILEVKHGATQIYLGTYEDYVWRVQKNQEAEIVEEQRRPLPRNKSLEANDQKPLVASNVPAKPARERGALPLTSEQREKKKFLEAEKRRFDKLIEDADRKVKILEARMNEQSQKLGDLSGAEAEALSRELGLTQKKIEELEQNSLQAMTQREAVIKEISELEMRF